MTQSRPSLSRSGRVRVRVGRTRSRRLCGAGLAAEARLVGEPRGACFVLLALARERLVQPARDFLQTREVQASREVQQLLVALREVALVALEQVVGELDRVGRR